MLAVSWFAVVVTVIFQPYTTLLLSDQICVHQSGKRGKRGLRVTRDGEASVTSTPRLPRACPHSPEKCVKITPVLQARVVRKREKGIESVRMDMTGGICGLCEYDGWGLWESRINY